MKEILEMSTKELERIKVLSRVKLGELSQKSAAKQLGISDRQVRNLLKRIEREGDRGIISKQRGKRSNHRLDEALKKRSLTLVREHYPDFGPTLANEYLKQHHQITVSRETLRSWMIKDQLWFSGKRKGNLHPTRARRGMFGELTQIDGSHHFWFEDRGPPCVLMVCIDDATSALTSLHFSENESLEAYYAAFEKHLNNYGIPGAVYGDKCSVLTPRNPTGNNDSTQFQKALKELGCLLILANSPQAKGRVERANRTLQDRLVKELRVRNISTIQDANLVLEEFREKFNKMFAKKPSEQTNAHRTLEGIKLENILTIRKTRTLTKDFTIQFNNIFYQISAQDKRTNLSKGSKIEIRQLRNDNLMAIFKGKPVKMLPLSQVECPILDEKQILEWKNPKKYSPSVNHPFKHCYHINKIKEDILRNAV